ncbi:winged helix-turn-helix domain-containing protein [Candidatus Enterococcus ferrettii]|uniref:OmpR/PhoB-type domain-containing protein n=1 Tax=Candidatus Enterococcus ferrettii TaxID=2815324 RepID=A0ABV0ER90_9ENTE|nr:helix-turn-helix domain-containing protein [Enterococcus sp. 665A]MBO1342306.1 winged helix-turn-helix domain-containing protein [Enterococcus sp. 665A]
MSQALLLTKNILANQTLQKKLQELNDEVWCSTWLLDQIQRFGVPVFVSQQFQVVIFGKSLSDEEVQTLLQPLLEYPLILLREVEQEPTEEEREKWTELGLQGYLAEIDSQEVIREKIALAIMKRNQAKESNQRVVPFPNSENRSEFDSTLIRLTGKEQTVMNLLVRAQGEVMTRKELCEKIWSEGNTASNMSQLSCMINRIKRKFENQGVDGRIIVTHWGRGYQLSDYFYQQCASYAQSFY